MGTSEPNAQTPAPPSPNETPAPPSPYLAPPVGGPRLWGGAARETDWLKVRALVGKRFGIARISKATITPERGANAGKARPSFVVELLDGHLFSVNETDSIGGQLTGMGLPTTGKGHVYTVEAQPSSVSRTGDALLLRELAPNADDAAAGLV